jgi:transposase-like protein
METPNTLRDAMIWFADFEHCRQFMIELRWQDGVVKCPRCGSDNVTYLEKARVWKCYTKHPSPTFTLKTGTIFEDSPIGLEKWLPAAWLIVGAKKRYQFLRTASRTWCHSKDRVVHAAPHPPCHARWGFLTCSLAK